MAETTTHTEVAAHGGGISAGFPPFDTSLFPSQLLWLAITFGGLWYFMSKVIVPRISGILEARSSQIARDLEAAHAMKKQTDDAIAGYEKAMADARSKAQLIAGETRAKLAADTEEKRKSAEAELANKLTVAESHIQGVKAKALAEVGGIATDTTEALVERLIGSAASKDEIAKAVAAAMGK